VTITSNTSSNIRSLPPLAKKYVIQMLQIDVPVAAKLLEEWVLPDGFSKHRVAIDRLVQLRVFLEAVDRYIFIHWGNVLFFSFFVKMRVDIWASEWFELIQIISNNNWMNGSPYCEGCTTCLLLAMCLLWWDLKIYLWHDVVQWKILLMRYAGSMTCMIFVCFLLLLCFFQNTSVKSQSLHSKRQLIHSTDDLSWFFFFFFFPQARGIDIFFSFYVCLSV